MRDGNGWPTAARRRTIRRNPDEVRTTALPSALPSAPAGALPLPPPLAIEKGQGNGHVGATSETRDAQAASAAFTALLQLASKEWTCGSEGSGDFGVHDLHRSN